MKKVGIVMGSDSDMPVMSKAAAILDKLGVEYEMKIISAHREPDVFFEYAKTAEEKGFKVIIAGAGMAAHLPGMCAAIFPMPVIGIPMHTSSLLTFLQQPFASATIRFSFISSMALILFSSTAIIAPRLRSIVTNPSCLSREYALFTVCILIPIVSASCRTEGSGSPSCSLEVAIPRII